jgi:hypothetical protein
MAKQAHRPAKATQAVTADRAARLYRLLLILAGGSQTRQALTRRLRLDLRGFYRDLEFLRAFEVRLSQQDGRYILEEDLQTATSRLPFPDPHLTLGEALQLAKGRSAPHRKLREQIGRIIG